MSFDSKELRNVFDFSREFLFVKHIFSYIILLKKKKKLY